RAVLRFAQARAGIMTSAASVIAMPLQLVSGVAPYTSARTATKATTPARTKSRIPANRAARSLVNAPDGLIANRTTVADSSSTKLSAPNARSAGLWAEMAPYRDTAHSTSIHIKVMLCNQTTVRAPCGGGEQAVAPLLDLISTWV